MTQIPYSDPGRASFELIDEYTQGYLLAGREPQLKPALGFPLDNNTAFDQFSVVGLDASGKLTLATRSGDAAAASGAITFSNVGSADDTIVIGDITYTLKAEPAAAYQVDIGGSAATTAANLAAAINASGNGAGEYGDDTEAHPEVTASAAGAVVTVTARQVGSEGNDIPTTETSSVAAFASTTLSGGRDAGGVQAIGVLAHAASLGASGTGNGQVWYSGCFDHAALTWHESFDTLAEKKAAFMGAPTPTTIVIGERF